MHGASRGVSRTDQGHQHRPKAKFTRLRFAHQPPQIAGGAADRRASLQDRGEDDRSRNFAHRALSVLPRARADAVELEARGGCQELSACASIHAYACLIASPKVRSHLPRKVQNTC
jgi:hypothetical protein